jgi:hypothetical protein
MRALNAGPEARQPAARIMAKMPALIGSGKVGRLARCGPAAVTR